jgi:hypothetical protein
VRTGSIGRRGRTNCPVGTAAVRVRTAAAGTGALVGTAAVRVRTAAAGTGALVGTNNCAIVSTEGLRQVGQTFTERQDRDRRRRRRSHSGPRSHGRQLSEERRSERNSWCVHRRQRRKTGGRDEPFSIGESNRCAHSYAGTYTYAYAYAYARANCNARAHTNAEANTYTYTGAYPDARVLRDPNEPDLGPAR